MRYLWLAHDRCEAFLHVDPAPAGRIRLSARAAKLRVSRESRTAILAQEHQGLDLCVSHARKSRSQGAPVHPLSRPNLLIGSRGFLVPSPRKG